MTDPATPLYFEDLTPGQLFISDSLPLSAEEIHRFAAEFDPQPFHLDHAAAANSLFGGLAASGWHTAAITMRLLVERLFRPLGGVIGAEIENLRWLQAVRPGDHLRVQAEVLASRSLRSRPGHGLVRLKATTLNQQGETVQEFVSQVLVPRRPAVATDQPDALSLSAD